MQIIDTKRKLFVVSLKGHVRSDGATREEADFLVTVARIFRNVEVMTDHSTFTDYVFDYGRVNHVRTDITERK
jgi:hypothetical protein